MSGRLKHMKRSRYSYQRDNMVTFAGFMRKAAVKSGQKNAKRAEAGFLSAIKRMFHRNQGK